MHGMISELMNMHDVSESIFIDFTTFKLLFRLQNFIILETCPLL